VFRISKPGTSSTNKTSTSTKQHQQQQSEQKPEKNSVLLEYKQFVESLQKAGPSAMLLDNSLTQTGKLRFCSLNDWASYNFKKQFHFSLCCWKRWLWKSKNNCTIKG